MPESHHDLKKVIEYMKSHWPSQVKPEWQVDLLDYQKILPKVIADFTAGATKNRQLFRIAGLSGSGKTTQILPATEAYCDKNNIEPILVAARRFVDYHPHKSEIADFYGEENLRKMTDEFSTIMMFLALSELIKHGYDIILDVTLLDPQMEAILLQFMSEANYQMMILMIATSPAVTEHFLKNRAWRHSKNTEREFIRATKKALEFYASTAPKTRIILWSVYDLDPIYDGKIQDSLDVFQEYSTCNNLPKPDDEARKKAKITYLTTDLN